VSTSIDLVLNFIRANQKRRISATWPDLLDQPAAEDDLVPGARKALTDKVTREVRTAATDYVKAALDVLYKIMDPGVDPRFHLFAQRPIGREGTK
jgi:hypothetical protein